jgi:tetratricopeptide (TPR) repeat protein
MESGAVMQTTDKEQFSRSKARRRAGFVVLILALATLAGCSSGVKVPPVAVLPKPVVPAVSSVTRLGEGREGFVIQEIPGLDAAAVKDFERAVVMMQSGDYEAASRLLEKVIKQDPGVTAPYINLAIARMHGNKPEQAEEALQAALKLIPAHPVASHEYGLLLRKAGRFAEARKIYEASLQAFPAYSPAHKNLGILCDLYLQDPGCALEHYESYSAAVPMDEQVKIWIADLRVRLKR